MAVSGSSANQSLRWWCALSRCLGKMGSWQQRDWGLLRPCPEFSSSSPLIFGQFCEGCLDRSPFLISPSNSTAGSSLVSSEGGVSEPRNPEVQASVTTLSYMWMALDKQFNLSELLFPLPWNRNTHPTLLHRLLWELSEVIGVKAPCKL